MSVVSLLGVKVINNPAKFTDKYEFEITFECLEQLEKGWCIFKSSQYTRFISANRYAADLEWKLTYVGSATSYVHLDLPISHAI
jgi:histone chaperone ASF1